MSWAVGEVSNPLLHLLLLGPIPSHPNPRPLFVLPLTNPLSTLRLSRRLWFHPDTLYVSLFSTRQR